ncbi:hypothetical protein ACFQZ4_37240 [Catellatospora coxensis]|uniref:Uncharacterized protein n=1 Tax=Catellatospora coxensis TaxID=310354 RepID=A0A8J3KIM5_9ACTN|nr:hypothetical protein [Catellatospora coxensis]GIG03762.1 hypothetical protein Cco03nite_04620 [Catellatospora coxensis]
MELTTPTLAALAAVVVCSVGAYWSPRLAGQSQRASVTMITVVRNLTLALMLAGLMGDAGTTTTVLAYGLLMYLAGVGAAVVIRSRSLPGAVG